MTDNSLYVDTDGIAKTVPYMQELAARFDKITQTTAADFSRLFGVWGDDASGKNFAASFVPASHVALTAMGGMTDLLRSVSDGLLTMAKGLDNTEQTNAENAAKISKNAGGGRNGASGGDSSHSGHRG